ncbi:MAG: hypothetical protein IJY39_14300 [Clostridia bacterium]|nr:hypothetical protein [Clostridia bacterium]
MFRIGVSSCGLPTTEETFAQYQAAGISAMEISVMPKEGDLLDAQEIASLAKEYGVELWSYHLPFHGYGIAYPHVAKITVDKL